MTDLIPLTPEEARDFIENPNARLTLVSDKEEWRVDKLDE